MAMTMASEKANIDANKFPEFTPELRRDMYRETTEFFTHLIREDRPVREIVSADREAGHRPGAAPGAHTAWPRGAGSPSARRPVESVQSVTP